MIYNSGCLYNLRPPSPQNTAKLYIADGTGLVVVGTLALSFHSAQDLSETVDCLFLPGLNVNLLSLHTVQARESIALDERSVHLMGARLIFPWKGWILA